MQIIVNYLNFVFHVEEKVPIPAHQVFRLMGYIFGVSFSTSGRVNGPINLCTGIGTLTQSKNNNSAGTRRPADVP